jgi:hypothetical protein
MTGAATLMHGYAALWGFGITRIRNQTVEAIPVRINVIFKYVLLLMWLIRVRILSTIFFMPVELFMLNLLSKKLSDDP